MLMIKGLIGSLVQPVLYGSVLLIAAGTWRWPRALIFIIAYTIMRQITSIILALVAPESLKARMRSPVSHEQPLAEKVLVLSFFLTLGLWLIFIALDVFRLHILPPPTLLVSIIGVVLFLAGYGIVVAAIYQNEFATVMVEDQRDRGQALVDSGLYGVVRHPLYLGIIPFFIGLALWLESYAGALAFPLVFVFLIIRIFVEEKYLKESLPGYPEYMKRVRYRLVPFIW